MSECLSPVEMYVKALDASLVVPREYKDYISHETANVCHVVGMMLEIMTAEARVFMPRNTTMLDQLHRTRARIDEYVKVIKTLTETVSDEHKICE